MMKRLLFILAIAAVSCKKDDGCKTVTVEIVNGCNSPTTITYAAKDRQYCGSELVEVRKLNNTYQDYNMNGHQCRVTTFVLEK